jgi:hypothetical protein
MISLKLIPRFIISAVVAFTLKMNLYLLHRNPKVGGHQHWKF